MSNEAEIVETEIATVVSDFVSGLMDLIRQTALDAARVALSDAAHPHIRSARPQIDLTASDAHDAHEEAESSPLSRRPGAVISPVSGQRIVPTSSTPIVPIVHPKTAPPLQLSLPLPTPRRFPPARRRTRNPRPSAPPPPVEAAPAAEGTAARKWVVVRRPARDKVEGAPAAAEHTETTSANGSAVNGSAMNGSADPSPAVGGATS